MAVLQAPASTGVLHGGGTLMLGAACGLPAVELLIGALTLAASARHWAWQRAVQPLR